MKIAIFSDNFYPELSGVTDSIIALAKNLSKQGQQIIFFAPRYSAKDFATANVSCEEINLGHNVKIVRFFSFHYPTSTKQSRMVIPSFWRWLKLRKEKIDIIHTQDFFGVGLEALVAAKLLKIPIVGTNHTPITEFLEYSPVKNNLIKNFSLHFVSWYYNKCDYITAPSQSILEEMKRYGLRQPSQAISNPIELKNYFLVSDEAKIELKKEFNFSTQTILCSGRLADEKHVDIVIKAVAVVIKKFPGANLAITGGGSAENSLKNLVKELKLENKVKFLGIVSPAILSKLYQAADIYAIASTAETQSISLMKAMATGLPVIGVRAWALPEYINNNNGFIVEPGDYQAMADKIVLLCQDNNLRKKLGQGRAEMVKNFSAENIAKQWEEIYSNVLNKKII